MGFDWLLLVLLHLFGIQLLLLAQKGDARLIKHFAPVYLVIMGSLIVITTVYIKILPPIALLRSDMGHAPALHPVDGKRTTRQVTRKQLKLALQLTTALGIGTETLTEESR